MINEYLTYQYCGIFVFTGMGNCRFQIQSINIQSPTSLPLSD